MVCYQTSYCWRPQKLNPAGEILAASAQLRPRLFHPRAEGVVVFVWLRAALGWGGGCWFPGTDGLLHRWQSRRALEAGNTPGETRRCCSCKSAVRTEVAKAGHTGGAPTASATRGNCCLEFSKDSNSLCHLNLPITLWGRKMCDFWPRVGISYSWSVPPASTAPIPNRDISCQGPSPFPH